MTSAASAIAARLRSRTATSRPAAPSASKPPVSTSSTARSPKRTTASFASRVTPGIGSTSALRRRSSRLKSVDLPAFGRPTSTTRGSAAAVASPSADAIVASTAASRSRSAAATDAAAARDDRRLEPELTEDTRVLAPFMHHLHVQLEEHAAVENRLQLQARRLADVADAPPAFADDDALLRRPLDEDGRLDHEEAARRLLTKRVDHDRRRVGQLVACLLDDLLAHDLGGEEALALLAHLIGGIEVRSLRQGGRDQRQHALDVVAGEGAHRHHLRVG